MSRMGSKDRNGRPALEWIVGIISAIVVVAILAFLSYEALFGDARPPDLVATIDEVQSVDGATLVFVTLANRGDQAAAEIAVEATVDGEGSELTRREIRFDYIAARAERRGAFVLEGRAVGLDDLRIQIHGFVEP